ncbi:MAG: cell wall-associated protein wapA [Bdellovibrionaceae bacterium]|nr:cell wall-associated protein wapA [Pseudobdellovibrionaceae bacterium]
MKNLLLVLLLLWTSQSLAIVDMKNANYSDYWVDLMIPGNNFFLRVSRTYNSRSLFSGIFGFGWCSNLETQVEISLEGNLLLSECGSSPVAYYPAKYNTKLINDSVDKIVSLIAKKYPEKTKKHLENLKDQLRSDHLLRTQLAGEVGVKISPVKNTVYLANGKEIDRITYDGNHYVHVLADSTVQSFDARGHLVQLMDKNKYSIKISYANDLPLQLVDNGGNKLSFYYYPEKKVKKIVGMNGLNATYKFRGENLVGVTNAWKNNYTYAYDTGHNLTRINFPDGTYKSITYVEMRDWVRTFRDRDGCHEAYDFVLSADNPKDHYSANAVKTCGKKTVYKSRYEFWYEMRDDKEKYLSRVLSEKNSEVLDISYHQDFGKPISLRRNTDITTMQYLDTGLIKQKTVSYFTPVDEKNQKYSVGFAYNNDNLINDILSEYFAKDGKLSRRKKTQFKYDSTGRLVSAKCDDGQFVEIKYNNLGLISSINNQEKKEIVIEYDENTLKPISLARPSVGSVKLTYASNGAIKKVQNKGGSSVNSQIYDTFNNFLDIIGPVSTELSLNL